MILYYRKNTQVTPQNDWTGIDDDACAPGWTGPECDACVGFGFSTGTESDCTECIENGHWSGSWGIFEYMEVFLTFERPECSYLVPGMRNSSRIGDVSL